MKTTLQKALAIFRTGDLDGAWAVAQQDEGLLPEVTKEQWAEWAQKIVDRDKTKHIAETILQQMGGQNKIAAMTGARNFVNLGNGVSFKFKLCRRFNYFKVILNEALDLYEVTLSRVDKWGEQKNQETFEGVYWDQLKGIFEQKTGLRLSL